MKTPGVKASQEMVDAREPQMVFPGGTFKNGQHFMNLDGLVHILYLFRCMFLNRLFFTYLWRVSSLL